MTAKVTKESLAENIGRLESYGDLSLNEEYQLKAYRMLLQFMQPVQLPSGFSVGDNEDDPSYFNDWCYESGEIKDMLREHGLEFTE